MIVITRNIAAVVAGFLLGGVVNMAIVMTGPHVISPPPGVDVSSMESLAATIHLFGPQHFIAPFLAHALGTLTGALVAYLVAATHRIVIAYTIGVLNLAGGIFAATMLPSPAWFVVTDLLLAYLPMAWAATRLGALIVPGKKTG